MSKVQWIKLTTDMFDNKKIKRIRHLPEGNNIVLIWVMLLTIAGRCNAQGMIFLTENIPYTTQILADELEFDPSVVEMALMVLDQFGMIICNEDVFCIKNWSEYQNIEGLEKIREQGRLRQKKWYDEHKAIPAKVDEPNVRSNVMLTQPNATDKELEIDKNKIKEKNNSVRFTPPTLEEVTSYCTERNNSVDPQRFIDYYESNGWLVGKNKMKNWQAAVRTWERNNNTNATGQSVSRNSAKDTETGKRRFNIAPDF